MINSILSPFGLRVKAAPPRPPYSASWSTFGMLAEDWSTDKLQRKALQCAWVYSNVGLLARKAGQGEFVVMEENADGEREKVKGHDFSLLMRRPNPLMSSGFLIQYSVMWLNLNGNAYWWLAPNLRGELQEIWPLPAKDVEPVLAGRGSNEVLKGYRYQNKLYPPEQFCHFRLANPYHPVKGLSPISALRNEITGDAAMKAWNTNFFHKKNAIPTTIISLPQDTNPVDFKRIRDTIFREFGGTRRRAMVTRAGDVKVESVGLSQKDMDFLAGIEMNKETIDRVFGVPSGYWDKNASRNNAATAELIVMRDTIQPMLDYFAKEIDAQIIDRFYDPALLVVATNLVPEDRVLNVTEFRTYSSVMRVGEARAKASLPMLGDERDEMLVPELTASFRGPSIFPTALPKSSYRPDLLTWQKVALREVVKGRDPGAREFVSDKLPGYVKAAIEGALMGAGDTAMVESVFKSWLDGNGENWIGYP